mmetsp:Transcript_4823/g.10048  ORF Transcript_4823/g.10048 Transcript_4823/m.10048 type:complete len:547 (-) Transcript_4823:1006-2646(-)
MFELLLTSVAARVDCWVGPYTAAQRFCCDRSEFPEGHPDCFDATTTFAECCAPTFSSYHAKIPGSTAALSATCPPLPEECPEAKELGKYVVPTQFWSSYGVLVEFAQSEAADHYSSLWMDSIRLLEATKHISCVGHFSPCFSKSQLGTLCAYIEAVTESVTRSWAVQFPEGVRSACMDVLQGAPAEPLLEGLQIPLVSTYHSLGIKPWAGGSGRIIMVKRMSHHLQIPPESVPGDACDLFSKLQPPWFGGEGDNPWIDVSGIFVQHRQSYSIVQSLQDAGIPLSKRVLNLGAFDGSCYSEKFYGNFDVANCLVNVGWEGVLFEGSPEYHHEAATRHKDKENVEVVLQLIDPVSLADSLKRRRDQLRDFDLLKIDIDHSECLFLEPVFNTVGLPKVIHAEINPIFPPDLEFVEQFQYPGEVIEGAEADRNRHSKPPYATGCSVGAFLSIMGPRYRLVQVEYEDALFVRSDLAHVFPESRRTPTVLWQLGYFCHPFARIGRDWLMKSGLDFRLLADERKSLDARSNFMAKAFADLKYTRYNLTHSVKT